MPARKPVRPTPGTALVMPRVPEPTTQRALDQVAVVTQQVKGAIAELGATIAKISTAGTRAAAPNSGTHTAGEIVFNADPVAGGFAGWICVAGGTPGAWKSWGAISP